MATPAYFARARNACKAHVVVEASVPFITDGGKCAHKWLEVGRIGKCLTTYTCAHCGAISTVDSSD